MSFRVERTRTVPKVGAVMSLDELRRTKREELLRLAARYGASNVRIFGSVARGTNTPQSDLDVLVDFEKHRSLLDQVGLKLDLEELLGCKVDVVEAIALKPHVAKRVLREAVPL